MLPVVSIYPDVIKALKQHPVVLLQAHPGAGKSTWLPLQLIRDRVFNRVVMLEPRRLAARNIAGYLAQQQNESVGQSIGLRIREEKYVSKNTQLEIVTEGMLTRMLQSDPELQGVDCIIFDEFHERSIAADTALAFALETQAALRENLKILLMSATLDAQKIEEKFSCPVLSSQGRSYPIDVVYHAVKNDRRWLDEIPALIKKALQEQPGSCLVFLPGRREIKKIAQQLSFLNSATHVFSLYGDQTKTMQQAAIAPAKNGERKVVLATNVAETSLTIEGIRIVVDSGKKRAAKFNLNTGVTELKTVNISIASATQRAGRAGRLEPGVVYRLGTEDTFNRREPHDTPDVLCSDISTLVLESKLWGADINQLELLDPPTVAQQEHANDLLFMLQAVDRQKKLTAHGRQLLAVGTDIRWAHMLVKAKVLEPQFAGIELLSIYVLALFDSRIGKQAEIISELQAQLISPHPVFTKQLNFWLKRLNKKPLRSLAVQFVPILVALAYPDRIAKRRGEGYLLASGAGVNCRDDYWLKDEFIAIAELGGRGGKTIFSATAINIHLLEEVLGSLFQKNEICEFDESTGRFTYENRVMLGAIVVSKKPIHATISEAAKNNAWMSLVKKNGFSLFECFTNNVAEKQHNECMQLLVRMMLAYKYFPKDYPEVSEARLLDTLDAWLVPYLGKINNVEQLKKIDLIKPLQNCFDWNQRTSLDALLPSRVKVPSGSSVAISYQVEGPAKMSVRMQEVYGLSSSPELCKGKVPLLMDLLSPARRSLQLTQDLGNFWRGSYHAIQKEMKGRYPRHFWPDKPEEAKATNKTKAKM